jgi:hypothetical protein
MQWFVLFRLSILTSEVKNCTLVVPNLSNAVSNCGSLSVNSTCTVTCNSGFSGGSAQYTCSDNAVWVGSITCAGLFQCFVSFPHSHSHSVPDAADSACQFCCSWWPMFRIVPHWSLSCDLQRWVHWCCQSDVWIFSHVGRFHRVSGVSGGAVPNPAWAVNMQPDHQMYSRFHISTNSSDHFKRSCLHNCLSRLLFVPVSVRCAHLDLQPCLHRLHYLHWATIRKRECNVVKRSRLYGMHCVSNRANSSCWYLHCHPQCHL